MERSISTSARVLATRGRAGRREFWTLTLICTLAFAAAFAVEFEAPAGLAPPQGLAAVIALATAGPVWLCAASRRLHDTGRSAWWLLAGVVPVGGWLILLVWFLSASQPALNRHGRPPRGVFWT